MVKGMHGKKPGEECAHTLADAGRFHLQHDTNGRLNAVLKAPSFHLGPFYTAGEETSRVQSVRAAAASFQLLRFFTLRERNSEDSTTDKIKN